MESREERGRGTERKRERGERMTGRERIGLERCKEKICRPNERGESCNKKERESENAGREREKEKEEEREMEREREKE